VFAFASGVELMRTMRPDLMYLSTTDYIQHKHAPGTPVANAFYAMMDRYLAELDSMGAVVALTADHGMKAKAREDGEPNVIYLDPLIAAEGVEGARVILPITDPYVVHHGALGSFATAYLPASASRADVIARLRDVPGIDVVLSREEAVARFELPADRIGDIVLTSTENMTIGTSAHRHDLAALDVPLRSHGGLTEQSVPFIVNRRMDLPGAPALRNFDAFQVACQAAAE